MKATEKWSILSLLNATRDYLEKKKIENPRLQTELLLCEVICCKRLDLYLNFDKPVKPAELSCFRNMVKRTAQGEPIQYIIGHVDFMGNRIKVDPRVLIPRFETEILVQKAAEVLSSFNNCWNKKILDLCTGSGCISVAIANLVPEINITATDISPLALALAFDNAKTNGVDNRIQFKQSDLFNSLETDEKFNLIVSNPPYISEDEYKILPASITAYEPSIALLAGKDGLDYYRHIFLKARTLMVENGILMLEIGDKQANTVAALAESHNWRVKELFNDLNSIPRVAVLI
ncbi:MAG: peptide chain release factor N(5)-glutamine methyltransferase [bacterium]